MKNITYSLQNSCKKIGTIVCSTVLLKVCLVPILSIKQFLALLVKKRLNSIKAEMLHKGVHADQESRWYRQISKENPLGNTSSHPSYPNIQLNT